MSVAPLQAATRCRLPAGIESLIADRGQAIDAGHESVEAADVALLARQEHEADQIAERIDDHRDLLNGTFAGTETGKCADAPGRLEGRLPRYSTPAP
jgi:hypothetical protein